MKLASLSKHAEMDRHLEFVTAKLISTCEIDTSFGAHVLGTLKIKISCPIEPKKFDFS